MTISPTIGIALGGGAARGWASLSERNISGLDRPFGAVASDLHRGRMVWLREQG